jgi:alpha-ribazole phosphatase
MIKHKLSPSSAFTQNKSQGQPLLSEFTLYLLRHGEIVTPGILAGKTDVELSKQGFQQLSKSVKTLEEPDLFISSPLKRCHLWAQDYAKQKAITLEVEQNLSEMDFGDWDGKTYQALWQTHSQSPGNTIGDFWQNPWQCQPPNGEKIENFVARVDSWWQRFCCENIAPTTLVVTHAGVIKHLIARVLSLPIPGTAHMASIDLPYASLVKITLYREDNGRVWPKLIL